MRNIRSWAPLMCTGRGILAWGTGTPDIAGGRVIDLFFRIFNIFTLHHSSCAREGTRGEIFCRVTLFQNMCNISFRNFWNTPSRKILLVRQRLPLTEISFDSIISLFPEVKNFKFWKFLKHDFSMIGLWMENAEKYKTNSKVSLWYNKIRPSWLNGNCDFMSLSKHIWSMMNKQHFYIKKAHLHVVNWNRQ